MRPGMSRQSAAEETLLRERSAPVLRNTTSFGRDLEVAEAGWK